MLSWRGCLSQGDSYRIQTCNLLIRSQMLYSVELRSQKMKFKQKFSDSYRIQTCNLLIRSQMLYSVELRSQTCIALEGDIAAPLRLRMQS